MEVLGDYNKAVTEAKVTAHVLGINGLLIQDTAFEGYEDIPQVRCPLNHPPSSQNQVNFLSGSWMDIRQ